MTGLAGRISAIAELFYAKRCSFDLYI